MQKVVLILSILLTVACNSTVKNNWDCPMQKGGICKTIQEIDYGYNNSKLSIDKNNLSKFKTLTQQRPNSFEELRSKEMVSRVVFAPYIDKAGNKHDISQVYYVEFGAEWKE